MRRRKTNRLLHCTIWPIVELLEKDKQMSTRNYPEYAAIEQHIRRANIERVVPMAEGIAGFIADCWNAIQSPPRPAAIIINGRFPGAGIKSNLVTPR
jgi:hypothetical protein